MRSSTASIRRRTASPDRLDAVSCSARQDGLSSRPAPHSPVIVLGAGPAGIGAALALRRDAMVLEQAGAPGGLCRTVEIDGAVFDLGGHSFHTPHPAVRDLVFGAVDMYEQRRDARCWLAGQLVDYPFQAHFDQLDDRNVAAACARDLATAPGGQGAAHFEAYLHERFGHSIAHHFLLPYNRKLWGRDLTRLSVEWTRERVASPAGFGEPAPVAAHGRLPLREDTTVAYPAHGGFGEIFAALARQVPSIVYDQTIASIDPARRTVTTAGGDCWQYHDLVSTLPLPALVALLPAAPAWVDEAVGQLEAIGLVLVFVVVDRPVDTAIQRVYCGDPSCPAHKFVVNHNSSPSLRARPRHGILAEISCEQAAGRADLEACVVRTLVQMGLVDRASDVRSTRARVVERAYPAPTPGSAAAVRRLTEWLAEQHIHPAGRFAEWAYINSDEALYRGLSLGERLRTP